MSELKVNKISPRSGTDVTLGDSGDTLVYQAVQRLMRLTPQLLTQQAQSRMLR
jgi:hypothetical protein